MDMISLIRGKAKANLKTIVFPEYNDKRVVEAAKIIEKEGIAKALLLTPDKMDPVEKEMYAAQFYELRKAKGIDLEAAKKTMDDTLYYAAMMTRYGKADGFVAGAAHTTADVARSAITCLGVDERINIVSSCFIMMAPDCVYGQEGVFVFADCGIVPEPSARQIACIALTAAELADKVLGLTPCVALLSYSTKGSAKGKNIDRVAEGLKMLKEMAPDILADGEMQVDAAIVPEVAKIKCPDSPVAGKANVLIFPSLEAGNIGYKLVERLAKARAVGPLLLGLKTPCSDLSRGCSVEDVVDSTAVVSLMAK